MACKYHHLNSKAKSSEDLIFEQFKKLREKTQKLEPKTAFFFVDFFGGSGKKTKKLQKCNFATLQLFGLVAFFYCFFN